MQQGDDAFSGRVRVETLSLLKLAKPHQARSNTPMDWLDDLFFSQNPYNVYTWGHALYIANANVAQGLGIDKQHWLKSLLLSALRTTGGGALKALATQAKLPIFTSPVLTRAVVGSWLLANIPQFRQLVLLHPAVKHCLAGLEVIFGLVGHSFFFFSCCCFAPVPM